MELLDRIAVLIDADNTQLSKMELVLRELSTYGRIVLKRAYANWKKDSLKKWEDEIKRLAIKAEQQFDYVSGKNATDMALVIDAIELLHSDTYNAFALVSSDSDYTPLAIKLRESGATVIGVGEKKTPESFRNSCDEFIFLENLNADAEPEAKPENKAAQSEEPDDSNISVIHGLLKKAYETYQNEDGFANVSAAGSFIKRAKPDFDLRSYGFQKLPQLIDAFPDKYEMKKFKGKGTVTIIAYKCINIAEVKKEGKKK